MGQLAKIDRNRNRPAPWREPCLDGKLADLLDRRDCYSDMPVIGPKTAASLQAFIDAPQPGMASGDDIEEFIGLLDTALPRKEKTDVEADALVEQYCRALADVPLDGLRHAYLVILRGDSWFPTVARIREAAATSRPIAYRRRTLVAQTLLMKHEREWRAPIDDPVSAEDVAQIRTDIIDGLKRQREERLAAYEAIIERERKPRRYCPACLLANSNPAVADCKAPNCGFSPDYQPGPLDGTYEEQEVAGGGAGE